MGRPEVDSDSSPGVHVCIAGRDAGEISPDDLEECCREKTRARAQYELPRPPCSSCMSEVLCESLPRELTELQSRYGTAHVWITGRTLGELSLEELKGHCLEWKASRDDTACSICPAGELCRAMPYHSLHILCNVLEVNGAWEGAKHTPVKKLLMQTRLARGNRGELPCPIDPDGVCQRPDDTVCVYCIADNLTMQSSYWRHTEDEFNR